MCYHSVSLFYIGSNNSDLESATQPGHSQEVEVIRFGDFRMLSLPFADVVLLTLPSHELQLTLEGFVVEREVLGMRNSTSKSETMRGSWLQTGKRWTLQVGENLLPQVLMWRSNVTVLFRSKGKGRKV